MVAVTSPAGPAAQISTSRSALRTAIADALWVVSAYELADICVSFGLPPESPDEDGPMSSKRSYVRRRLHTQSRDELLDLARKVHEEYPTDELALLVGSPGYRGVDGELKNLIFAANGLKPRIVLKDAVNNTIEIVENAEFCLVYDRPLAENGLTWLDLISWWTSEYEQSAVSEQDARRNLYDRLLASMADNEVEQFVFAEYCKRGLDQPALIPQVYLHYDPYTRRTGGTLLQQRMDFLMLLPNRRRVVLEIDGVQHYADEQGRAVPRKYAQMVSADRELQLAGYEVHRFGGHEFVNREAAADMISDFFNELF
jgi:hypothetical protein